MKIVSYNILHGGEGRADPLAEVILARNPDVVCLIEADDRAVLERISRRLNMDYVVAAAGRAGAGRDEAGRDGVALLSRWPIIQSVDHAVFHERFTGSFLEAVVAEPGAGELPIGVVHLSAKATEAAEQKRESEIAVVLDVFASYRSAGRPHVLAGDFNSNAPGQEIDPAKCKAATRDAWESNGRMIPRRVVQRLLDHGYSDSLHAFAPHHADKQASFTTKEPGQRVDYIFTYGLKRPRDAWIEQDRLAKYASDHFPVGVEI